MPRIAREEGVWGGLGAQATLCSRNTVLRDGEVTEGDVLGDVPGTWPRGELGTSQQGV